MVFSILILNYELFYICRGHSCQTSWVISTTYSWYLNHLLPSAISILETYYIICFPYYKASISISFVFQTKEALSVDSRILDVGQGDFWVVRKKRYAKWLVKTFSWDYIAMWETTISSYNDQRRVIATAKENNFRTDMHLNKPNVFCDKLFGAAVKDTSPLQRRKC